MTVEEIYEGLNRRIPDAQREPWDNDGLMCAPDCGSEVRSAIVALDITESVVDYAISEGVDLIVTHHPLIFKPIYSVSENGNVSRKVIKLIQHGISVISLHTRADKVTGGVNDILADVLGIADAEPFGEGSLGRIGMLDEETSIEEFSYNVKEALGADCVKVSDACIPVQRVAVVGGDGKDFVKDALALGADTYVSGRISYNMMVEAAEMGINLIEAGHYFTEAPVTAYFQELLYQLDPDMDVEIVDSNLIKTI